MCELSHYRQCLCGEMCVQHVILYILFTVNTNAVFAVYLFII